MLQLKERAAEMLELLPQVPRGARPRRCRASSRPARSPTSSPACMDIKPRRSRTLLETFDLETRLDKLLELLAHRIEVLRLSREIGEQTQGTIDERQREHLLREQLRTIQKELGEGDESARRDRRARQGDRRGAACPRRSRSTRARS